MTTLLDLTYTDTLITALKDGGYDTIDAVLALTEDQLKALQYKNLNGNSHFLYDFQHALIWILVAFSQLKMKAGQPIHLEDWTKIDEMEFENWRLTEYQPTRPRTRQRWQFRPPQFGPPQFELRQDQ